MLTVTGTHPARVVRALALSGGGSKIAFHAGVLAGLLTGERRYNVVGGTSCGSLAGAIIAQGEFAHEQAGLAVRLQEILYQIKSSDDIYKGGSWISRGFRLIRTGAMHKPEGAIRLIAKHIDEHKLQNSKTLYRAGAVDMRSGLHLVIANDGTGDLSATRDTILASSSMPCFFPVVRVGDHLLVDGGVRDMTPLRAIVKAMKTIPANTYELDVVLASPLDPVSLWEPTPKPRDPLWLAGRALSLLENEVFRGDLREALWRNNEEGFIPINVRVFAPEPRFFRELKQGVLEFVPQKLQRLMAHGLERALQPYTNSHLETALL